tara:strand:+ start:5822 stop:6697 length:876 start_codon:yes stop_codon:yes gene_type:complete
MKSLKIAESITNRDNKSFKKYLAEVNTIEPLDVDTEFETALLSFEGDDDAIDRLVKHNLRFVISVAKQYVSRSVSLEDLVNEGNIGLIIAAKKFDPSRGFKFISYAVWWIRRSILTYIADNSRLIRYPNNKHNVIQQVKKAYISLEQQLERQPSYYEVLDVMNHDNSKYDEADVAFFIDATTNEMLQLDSGIKDASENFSFYDVIPNDNCAPTNALTNISDSEYNITKILSTLDKQIERDALILLYGLGDEEPLTLKSAALKLNLTPERIRQIRNFALYKLKKSLGDKFPL